MMKPRLFALLLVISLLVACAGGPAPRNEVTRHDLSAIADAAPSLPLRSIDVAGSSWLATPTMHYRMAGNTERLQFAQNRWLAPPAEMIAQRLKRGLPGDPAAKAVPCNLRLELDDLAQVFSDSQHSELRLDARASLFTQQGILARQNFNLVVPAGADAPSAAAVSGQLVHKLAQGLHVWSKAHCL